MKLWKQLLVSIVLVGAAFLTWSALYPGAHDVLSRNGLERISFFAPSGDNTASTAPSGPRGGGPSGAQEALVIVAPVAEGLVNDKLTAIGTGQAARTVSVRTLVSGQIAEIPVRPGSKVERGDVLMRLDSAEEELAVERARLTVNDAKARADRLQSLVASRAASSVEADQAKNALDTAEVALRQSELELSRRTVTAPISGSLGILAVDTGDYVTSQTEIASIDDRSEILIEFFVPERFTAGMEIGKMVTASAVSRPGEVFEGEISAVDNRVDEASRTLRVRARIANADDTLRAGMSFEVSVAFEGERWPAVDPLAIQWDSTGAYVWQIADGKAQRVNVAIIQRNSDSVLVRADLVAGDEVVTEGVQSVRPGSAVRVLGGAEQSGAGGEPTAQSTTPVKTDRGSGA
ncbi:MAG: efflux RND transporter periplasmic adaptor subunit [Hoeflea sp.]|uniref:efflux RND transporter periplasmic adaptor subunit n=1 Tax=Hoeflea sp. TaxID=1940281 RepID=UPI001DC67AF5|nr:efflux RND transporter periplasmic adaptor subunit [Hoeflea sp.]MBU4527870.1 efflux RND transporter periplasmic adaptor subunit [Alphaproteobacteria bacterium]MBU4546095.1 efflux RND transporter periplasmic adaptor subunit [Alphaproteobacteria bacterium]MBU4553220.1 efflux RND transporter periplasmic adaptor subunit [Alphaproteobacteria bacterium]MBV1724292.1 efflux RND transporter periplasmic adaptor subunit [Hoeflea sp.]MBV1759977.1 efflux RND transporter periplasmic adaptor subunit [Hoef